MKWRQAFLPWVKAPQLGVAPRYPFDVACACGFKLHGTRTAKAQALTCGECGRRVFVLPLSSLPPVAPAGAAVVAPAPRKAPPIATFRKPRSKRLYPIAAAGAGLVVLCLIAAIVKFYPFRAGLATVDERDLVQRHLAAGRRALREGSFQSAAADLNSAMTLRLKKPDLLPPAEARDLTHLQRQAQLLANLLTEPLEEILQRLDGLNDQEGQAVFQRHYHKKSVVFLAQLRRTVDNQIECDYHIQAGRRATRLELDKLKLLQRLPLQTPYKLLFGATISGIEIDSEGQWLIAFEPDSGLLLTDEGAARACCFQPGDDSEVAETLRRQNEWLKDLP